MPITVKKNHQKVKRDMRGDIAAGENRAVSFLVQEAKRNIAPHRKTGRLEDSIEQTITASTGNTEAEARVGADYGRIVDHGSVNQVGTFFWTRALLAMQRRRDQFFKRR